MTNSSKNGFRQLASPPQTDSQFKSSRASRDRTVLNQIAPSQTTLNQTVSNRSALGQATPGQTTLNQTISNRSALGQATPSQTTLDQTISNRSALGQAAPNQAAPNRTAPDRAARDQAALNQAVSNRVAPDQAGPDPDEMRFFIYLLEQYAAGRDTTADKVLKEWDRLCITDVILGRCACYRSESLENAFIDIDSLQQNKNRERSSEIR